MTDCRPADHVTVFVPEISAFGGVERLLHSLSTHLRARKRPHRVVCLRQQADFNASSDGHVEVVSLDPPRQVAAEAYALRRFAHRHSERSRWLMFDLKGAFYAALARMDNFVLHLTDPPSLLPLDVSKHARMAQAALGHVCDDDDAAGVRTRIRGELVHRINRSGVRRARAVVVMTRRISAEVKALYGRDAIVLPPGVEQPNRTPCDSGRRRKGIPRVRILVVSRLEATKRLDSLFQSLKDTESRVAGARWPDWQLDVIGVGSAESALRQLASALGLEGRVIFHGAVDEAELAQFYQCADLAVVPGVQGYGLPAQEALARHIPVVVHADSGVSELLAGSAWVEIVRGGQADLFAGLSRMIARIRAGQFDAAPGPEVASAAQWAESMMALLDAATEGALAGD